MTLDDIQQEIALDFDNTSTIPTSTTIEYTRRTKLINRFERLWRSKKMGKWSPLYTTAPLSTTGSQSYVTLPVGYEKGTGSIDKTGFITIGTTHYNLVNPDDVGDFDTTTPLVWITGNNAVGFKLNVQPTPTGVTAFNFSYFTNMTATDTTGVTDKSVLTINTDKTKIPNPYYLVYSVISVLSVAENGNDGRGVQYERLANEAMEDMIMNDVMGELNQVVTMDVTAIDQGFSPFGAYENDQ